MPSGEFAAGVSGVFGSCLQLVNIKEAVQITKQDVTVRRLIKLNEVMFFRGVY
ncbi:MAG: hypothetical protein HC778_03625 [Chamaesiphon sp. CSU_1_12]|nr:hypothetical protein [Chamaesiphon sp. CSU_1_12]